MDSILYIMKAFCLLVFLINASICCKNVSTRIGLISKDSLTLEIYTADLFKLRKANSELMYVRTQIWEF